MDLNLVTIVLLALVSGAYWAGYRTGFKASQAKTAALFESFSGPVTALLDRLNASADRAAEPREEKEQGGG